MTEHDTAHDSIACSDQESLPTIDAALGAEDGPARLMQPPAHAAILSDAKRYRKRAQAAEIERDKLKDDLAAREKAVTDLTQTVQQERALRKLESLLRDAGAVDFEAALALAERSLMAKAAVTEPDVNEAVAELQRMRPWLFRSQASLKSANDTGVMCAAASGEASTSRAAKIKSAAGEAIATGARTDLLRYLRLRRPRKR
jgi:hypothetical protein